MDVADTVAEGANYEYRCENVVNGCTTVVTGATVESTTILAKEHVALHHPATKVTAEKISDNIEPILVR
jgi:hypothetical protein